MARKAGFKTVDKDKAVFNDGTVLTMRNGEDLLKAYHSAVYDILMGNGTQNKNPITNYVKEGIKKLESNSLITIERVVNDTAEYFASNNNDRDFIEYKISKSLFTWQKDLLIDNAKKITLLAGRRSGKSYGEAAKAVAHCIDGYDDINGFRKPRKVAIIGLTCEKCADVFWQNVLHYCDESGMKYKPDNSKHSITFENGATIDLFGNSSKAEREKIRGTEFSLIIIDEAQSQNGLEYLLTDILEPIIVGRDSTIILSGTGSLTGYGKWADVTTGELCQHYKHYSATMADNPTIPDKETALQRVLDEHNWTTDNITFQREYLGKNVIDTSRMVFPTIHYYKEIPEDFIAVGCFVGLDYGFSDYNAFAPIVWDQKGRIFLVGEKKFNKASVTEIVNAAKEVDDFINKTFKVKATFVADNSDQSISREIYNRGIKIQNAYKVDLQMQINRLQEVLTNGTLSIVENSFADKEAKQTVWKWDEEKKSVIYEIDDDYFHPDILHALRYAVNTYLSKYKK